jgi:hypothetical protein
MKIKKFIKAIFKKLCISPCSEDDDEGEVYGTYVNYSTFRYQDEDFDCHGSMIFCCGSEELPNSDDEEDSSQYSLEAIRRLIGE